jgi:DNA-directed RNA polymerase subunit M/transcription elongation factor TFIIS
MKVVEINRNDCLTTTVYDPSPNRFNDDEIPVSERNIPIIYTCVKCQNQISFSADDFQKHDKSKFSNLNLKDKSLIDNFVIESTQKTNSFIDFYCPRCKLATSFFYQGGPSGFWGVYKFQIINVLIVDSKENVKDAKIH